MAKRRIVGKRSSRKIFKRGTRPKKQNGLPSTARGIMRGGIRF